MRIGVPKEIKDNEFRVGVTPGSAREYVARGHWWSKLKNHSQASGFNYVKTKSSIPICTLLLTLRKQKAWLNQVVPQ